MPYNVCFSSLQMILISWSLFFVLVTGKRMSHKCFFSVFTHVHTHTPLFILESHPPAQASMKGTLICYRPNTAFPTTFNLLCVLPVKSPQSFLMQQGFFQHHEHGGLGMEVFLFLFPQRPSNWKSMLSYQSFSRHIVISTNWKFCDTHCAFP